MLKSNFFSCFDFHIRIVKIQLSHSDNHRDYKTFIRAPNSTDSGIEGNLL